MVLQRGRRNRVPPSIRTRGISLDIIMKKTRTFLLRCRAHRPRAFDVLANLHFAFLVPWHTQTILSSLLHRLMLCVSYSQCVTVMPVNTLRAAAQCIVVGPVCCGWAGGRVKHTNTRLVCVFACLQRAGGVCLWVCYHDNSKLRASIFTKLVCR